MKKKYLIKAACLFSVAMLMGCAQEEDNSKTEKKGRASAYTAVPVSTFTGQRKTMLFGL